MPVMGLLPIDGDDLSAMPSHKFLTFLTPAPEGCNLSCGFCLIRQRRKSGDIALTPHHYARFIREAAAHSPIYAVSIQGYEPLLPAARAYTQAILATARLLDIPTGLVTNGIHLATTADWLVALAPTKIAVSLDATQPAVHDHLRGKVGAWATTVAGIERATAILAPRTKLAVASVLMPAGASDLEGMPRLLRSLGINDWIVTPLQKVERDTSGGPVGNRQRFYESLARLQDAADAVGMRLTVDDELDGLQHKRAAAIQPELRCFRVRTIPAGVDLIRLGPDGTCSVGREVLRQVSPDLPRWQTGMHAGEFLERLLCRTTGV